MLTDVIRDVAFALRTLLRSPGFTVVAVLALTLGIGANTTVFSVVEAALSVPFVFDDPDRATLVYSENPERNVSRGGVSVDDFLDWREQSISFDHLVAATPRAFNLTGGGEPVRIRGTAVTPGFFPITGLPLSLGRSFHPSEAEPAGSRVAILSHSFFEQRFAADPTIVGRQVSLDGEAYTVIGVAPEEFFFPDPDNAVWIPLVLERGLEPRDQRGALFALGLLRKGVSDEQATVAMRIIARRIEAAHPDTNTGWTVRVIGLRRDLVRDIAFGMTLLYGSITFVLLIACANVGNLLLSRATVREREMALRTTLGAGRSRLVRQLLTESLLLAGVGGALGLLVGLWGMRVLRSMIAPDPSIGIIADRMEIGSGILLHTLGISLVAVLLFGLAPALSCSRPNLSESLKEGGRGGGGSGRGRRLRALLVMGEVALALALLGTTGAVIRAFNHIYTADPGFDQESLLTFQLDLPEADYPEPHQVIGFYREARERLARVPGISSATAASSLPLTVLPGRLTARVAVEGAVEEEGDDSPNVIDVVVGPDYFETLELGVTRGRSLDHRDREDTLQVAVVSEAAARQFWPREDAVGKRFRLSSSARGSGWITVVGVAEDLQSNAHSLRRPTPLVPHLFLPLAQHPRRGLAMMARTTVEPTSLSAAARRAVWEVDPNQPIDNVATMEAVIARIDTQNSFFVRVLSGLSIVALLLAGIGIYGVISFAVDQRTQEIGVRMALGARPGSILLLVLRQGAIPTLVGLIIGLGLAVTFVRLMGTQLEGISLSNAGGPLTWVGVSLVLLLVANLACLVPARRSTRIDPLQALRHE